ncbi:hypothetical protein C8R47DRAFT_1081865 [Mycena vitilis]|nr:hypothetical protein C8R47DRAFT_1081865 [Mycena vitilis]
MIQVREALEHAPGGMVILGGKRCKDGYHSDGNIWESAVPTHLKPEGRAGRARNKIQESVTQSHGSQARCTRRYRAVLPNRISSINSPPQHLDVPDLDCLKIARKRSERLPYNVGNETINISPFPSVFLQSMLPKNSFGLTSLYGNPTFQLFDRMSWDMTKLALSLAHYTINACALSAIDRRHYTHNLEHQYSTGKYNRAWTVDFHHRAKYSGENDFIWTWGLEFNGTSVALVGITPPSQYAQTMSVLPPGDGPEGIGGRFYTSPTLPAPRKLLLSLSNANGITIDYALVTVGNSTNLQGQTIIVDDASPEIFWNGN